MDTKIITAFAALTLLSGISHSTDYFHVDAMAELKQTMTSLKSSWEKKR